MNVKMVTFIAKSELKKDAKNKNSLLTEFPFLCISINITISTTPVYTIVIISNTCTVLFTSVCEWKHTFLRFWFYRFRFWISSKKNRKYEQLRCELMSMQKERLKLYVRLKPVYVKYMLT